MTPAIGSRAFWLTIVLAASTIVIWGLASGFGWDPSAPLATIGVLGGAAGVGKAGEWIGRGMGATTDDVLAPMTAEEAAFIEGQIGAYTDGDQDHE